MNSEQVSNDTNRKTHSNDDEKVSSLSASSSVGDPAKHWRQALFQARVKGGWRTAQALLSEVAAKSLPQAVQHELAAVNHPIWWAIYQGRHISLRRCGPQDADMLRTMWANRAIMQGFHRMAPVLPASPTALQAILGREYWSSPMDRQGLNLVVVPNYPRTSEAGAGPPHQEAMGLVSLADWSPQHRRVELLMGMINRANESSPFAAIEACLLAMHAAFTTLNVQRLCAMVYADNTLPMQLLKRLGFTHEGTLRANVVDPHDGHQHDVAVFAMLANDLPQRPELHRLAQRLVGPNWMRVGAP